jgi:hypothetical protein
MLKLVLDAERMTFDDMIEIQEGKLRRLKEIIAKFAVDESGKPLDRDAAAAAAGGLSLIELRQVMEEMNRQMGVEFKAVLPNE